MAPKDPIKKIAIVGATGRIGGHFATELLKSGKHTITALTRPDSKAAVPSGVIAVKVDYSDEAALVSALRGQQFLIITLGVDAPHELHGKIVDAAAKAGVSYIMPNLYGQDARYAVEQDKDDIYMKMALDRLHDVEKVGLPAFNLVCGFWYEWSLALGEPWFGFTIKDRKVTFYDDGNTTITVSTWDQCGRAVAALLVLPEEGATPSLVDWKNKPVYIASFNVSQRDILDSLHRVLGTTDKDWEITYEPTEKRYKDGLEEAKKGIRSGFAKALYAKVFFPGGSGDHVKRVTLANEVLGLPKDDLDFCTKRAVDMVESGWNPWANSARLTEGQVRSFD